MTCGRNKSTILVKELAHKISHTLAERMKSGPFTLSTDGSNDEKSKQYPVVIRTLDMKSGSVNSDLLSVPICEGSASGNIHTRFIVKMFECNFCFYLLNFIV
jgi:hypothetical protein